jgi:hypothetical protein
MHETHVGVITHIRAPPSPTGESITMSTRVGLGGPIRGVVLLLLLVLAAPRLASAQGSVMFDTKGVSDKPQSKLWHHDGYWWAVLNNSTKLTLYKLADNTWAPLLDLQAAVTPSLQGGTCDVLWDGTSLFVAVWGSSSAKIYKLSYDGTTQTYAVLSGFPVSIPLKLGAETIVIAKDGLGRLWATFEAEQKIYVHYTTSVDHKSWSSTPLVISTANVDPDDIATIVTTANGVGVCWSDQLAHRVVFREHVNGNNVSNWQPIEIVRSGFGVVDDHLNMKADSQGRVYLVAKDWFDAVYVARRDLDGTWSLTTGASGLDCGTRPILQIDEASNKLYVFYTRWSECVSTGVHSIEERVSYLDNLLFSLPTVIIASPYVIMNEVQGSKQILPPGSMAIVCQGSGKAYWNGWGPTSGIGGTDPGGLFPPPPEPPANLAAGEESESSQSRLLLWKLDENTGTQAIDSSGNGHNGTFGAGIAAPHWAPGVMGSGLFFDGDNYITVGGSAGLSFLNQSFTLEAWVKPDLTNAPGTGMIFSRSDTLHTNYQLSLTDNTIRFEWSYDDTTDVSVKYTGNLRDGQWHHIAAVYDNPAATARIFVDGVLRTTKAVLPPTIDNGWNTYVGGLVFAGIADKTFSGTLDLLAVAGSALYSSNFTPSILYPSSSTRYERVAWSPSSSVAGIMGYEVRRSVNGGTPVLLTPTPHINAWYADLAPPDGFLQYDVRAVDGLTQRGGDASAQSSWESNPPAVPTAPRGLAHGFSTATVDGPAFWEMDEGSGPTLVDGTDLGHTAQRGGAAAGDNAEPQWAESFSGTALHFDGSNDYAFIDDRVDLRFTGSYTLEAWVRRTKLNTSGCILSKDQSSSKRNYAIIILSNGNIEFSWSRTSGSSRKATSTTGITDMEWHHVACVYDKPNTENYIYLDGQLVGQADVSGTVYTGDEPVVLGCRVSSGSYTNWLNADLDLVRISAGMRYTEPFTPPQYYRGGPRRRIVNLNWNLPDAGMVAAYDLYRQQLPSGSNTRIATVPMSTPFFTDTNVQDEITYRYTVRALNSDGDVGPAGAPLDVTIPLPTDVAAEVAPPLRGARLRVAPNPFNPTALVNFRVEQRGPVQVALYDVRGRRIATLVDGELPAGEHRVAILPEQNAPRLASGVYFVHLRADGRDTRVKAVLVQ